MRFLGAMMIGIGVIFFWTILTVEMEAVGVVIYVLVGAVAIGAAARIYARIAYGDPGTAGAIPIVLEGAMSIFLILLRLYVARDVRKAPKCGMALNTRPASHEVGIT